MEFFSYLSCPWNPKSKKQRLYFCILSAFLWGFVAHGVALVTKFMFQDEPVYLFSVGSTVASGRWFLGLLGGAVRLFFGSPNFSTPLLGGFWILFLTGLASFQMAELLNLHRTSFLFLFCGLTVTFPVTVSLVFFNFTAPYYLVGLCLAIAGSSILCRKRGLIPFLVGVLFIICSTAVYQSYISIFMCLALLFFMREARDRPEWSLPLFFREVLWYCGAFMVILLGYLLSVKISIALCGQELVKYKGLSSMGDVTAADLFHRAKLALYLFVFPQKSNSEAFLLPYRMLDCYYLCLVGLAGLGAVSVIQQFRVSPLRGLSVALSLGFFPLAVNSIFVMCDPIEVYTLMQASGFMPFLLLLLLADQCKIPRKPIIQKLVLGLMAVFCVFSLRVDNATYEKARLMQERTELYFTVMVAQIRSTPGYTAATPVAYIGTPSSFGDSTFHQITGYSDLPFAPLRFDATPVSIGNTWQEFINLRCGFAPPAADPASFAALPQVQEMPCYPDNGSIRMISGTIVVKLTSP